jgi:hypothetical protein
MSDINPKPTKRLRLQADQQEEQNPALEPLIEETLVELDDDFVEDETLETIVDSLTSEMDPVERSDFDRRLGELSEHMSDDELLQSLQRHLNNILNAEGGLVGTQSLADLTIDRVWQEVDERESALDEFVNRPRNDRLPEGR